VHGLDMLQIPSTTADFDTAFTWWQAMGSERL